MGGIPSACSRSPAQEQEIASNQDALESDCNRKISQERPSEAYRSSLSFEEAVKEIRNLLRKKEAKQIELHNEVIQWRLNDLRGSWKRESRQRAYDLIQQFIALHENLDDLLDLEKNEVDTLVMEYEATHRNALGSMKLSSEDVHIELDPMLSRRKIYFEKFHERHVKLLLLVLAEVQECRRMVEEFHDGSEDRGAESLTPCSARHA